MRICGMRRHSVSKITFLVYGMCRGDHWSPANLAQHRVFRNSFLTRQAGTGEQCSPLQEFFDSLNFRRSDFASSCGSRITLRGLGAPRALRPLRLKILPVPAAGGGRIFSP